MSIFQLLFFIFILYIVTIQQSGGLQFLQELNETVGGKLTEFITQINNCYPPEVVEFYSPNYSKTLLQKIDEYQPGY